MMASATRINSRQGEMWHKMRSVVNPVLMKPKLVQFYIPTIDGIVKEFIANLSSIQDDKGEMPANFMEYLNKWSLESITAIALEKRLGLMNFKDNDVEGEKIAKAVRTIIDLGLDFEMKPSLWRYFPSKNFKILMTAYNDLTE
jgi:cytochrome P450 family 12